MKKVLAINASPRQEWNTAQTLEKALQGAASTGAQTRLVHLYELDFKGCASCFACKRHQNNAALCSLKDDLQPLLREVMESHVLILGTPIYFGDVTAGTRAFLERLFFMNYTYDPQHPTKCQRSIVSGMICTMNITESMMQDWGYPAVIQRSLDYFAKFLRAPSQWLPITDTLQFPDYSKYMSSFFDPVHKARMREEKFPADLEAAYQFGLQLALAAQE